MNSINLNIKELRVNKGLTQTELGEKIGVNPKVISKWENNESLPSSDLLPQIADVFEISIDKLFNRISDNNIDIFSIVRKFGYDNADNIPQIQHLFSYIILGMQEREDKDSGFYTNKALEEISNDLVSFIENNDSRPQCKLINKEYGIVNYLLNNFRITTMTYCEKEKFDELIAENYPKMQKLFETLSLDGSESLVKFFLNTNENVSFTLDYLIAITKVDENVAKSFLDVLFAMNNSSKELVIQKETAMIDGKITEIYNFYPYNETNMLKTVLLSAVLLLKDKGGYR